MQVTCSVERTEVETDSGAVVEGLEVTCDHCGAQVEVPGTTEASLKYAFVRLHDECDHDAYYVADYEDE